MFLYLKRLTTDKSLLDVIIKKIGILRFFRKAHNFNFRKSSLILIQSDVGHFLWQMMYYSHFTHT